MYIVNSSSIFPPLFHSADLQRLKCISHLNILYIFVELKWILILLLALSSPRLKNHRFWKLSREVECLKSKLSTTNCLHPSKRAYTAWHRYFYFCHEELAASSNIPIHELPKWLVLSNNDCSFFSVFFFYYVCCQSKHWLFLFLDFKRWKTYYPS